MQQSRFSIFEIFHISYFVDWSELYQRRYTYWFRMVLCLLMGGVWLSTVRAGEASPALKIVVPSQAGGDMDQVFRLLSKPLSRILAQPVIIENRPGAQTMTGTESVIRSEPDGRTLLAVATSIALNPSLFKMSIDPLAELTAVAGVIRQRVVLVVRKDFVGIDLQKVIVALQNSKAHYSCGAPPGVMLLGCHQLRMHAAAHLTVVPYNGIAPLSTAVAGGHLDMAFLDIGTATRLHHDARVRLIALGEQQHRGEPWAELPRLNEQIPDLNLEGFFGLMAPAKTPADKVDRLAQAIKMAQEDPEFNLPLTITGRPLLLMGPQAFGDFLRSENRRLGHIVKQAGIQSQ